MTKIQIVISIVIGIIISGTLFFWTVEKINPLVSGPSSTFHVRAYIMKGGWPVQIKDNINYTKTPSGKTLLILLVNTLIWIVIVAGVVFVVNRLRVG